MESYAEKNGGRLLDFDTIGYDVVVAVETQDALEGESAPELDVEGARAKATARAHIEATWHVGAHPGLALGNGGLTRCFTCSPSTTSEATSSPTSTASSIWPLRSRRIPGPATPTPRRYCGAGGGLVLLRVGVCFVLLLSSVACRQTEPGPDQTDAAASPRPAGDLEAWAGGLCGALNRWEEAAVRLGGEAQQAIAQKPSPTEGKQILRDLLDPLLVETRLLIGDVEELGAPPVGAGAEIARRLGDGLNHTLGILLKARATAEALPQNRKAFLVGTQEVNRLIQGAVTRIETTIKDIDESFDEPELAAAFEESRRCGGSPT